MGTLYVGWEEVIASNDKGRREVHYYLKRKDGNPSDLAVVGKEKTLRHMSYRFVVNTQISNLIPNAKFKSRRQVHDWLSLVVEDSLSHGSSFKVSSLLDDDAVDEDAPALEDSQKRNLGIQSKEFMWLGAATTGRKRRQHYCAFSRNGITISVHDFVYVLAEENKRLVAYLEDLYEDSKGNKMVVVRWFHKIDEVGIVLPTNFNDREIFFSLCLQDLSVECIDGLAAVLSLQHFKKYLNEATHTLWQPFLCYRQFDNDDITDFDISQVQGYWKQEILRYMFTSSGPKPLDHLMLDDIKEVNVDLDGDDEDAVWTRPRKKHRTSKCKDTNDSEEPLMTRPIKKQRTSKSKQIGRQLNYKNDTCPTHVDVQKLCDGLVPCAEVEVPCIKNPTTTTSRNEITHDTPQKNLDCCVEVLSQDSGIRGCWFRAVVVKRSKEKVKVRYEDIKDAEDETKNAEEWVLASRIAASDQLGIRVIGRTTIRPFPPSGKDGDSLRFVDVGTPVDAWWHDGWWEGIVVRNESDGKIHVYFPGEKKMSIFDCNDLRLSQDWLCNRWFPRDSRPDLASSILSGIETQQDVAKSFDSGCPLIEPAEPNRQPSSRNIVDSSSPGGDDRATCNPNAPLLEPQTDGKNEIKGVTNLAKDNLLFQLRWNPSRKRRRGRDRLQRRGSCLKQHSDGSSSNSSGREDCDLTSDCRRLLAPDSLKFDQEGCKYQRDSLLNASIPPLTGLVLSR